MYIPQKQLENFLIKILQPNKVVVVMAPGVAVRFTLP